MISMTKTRREAPSRGISGNACAAVRGRGRRRSSLLLLICSLALLGLASSLLGAAEMPPTRGEAAHVVLVVWDGMRPEFVSEGNTPNLWKLARSGVTFRNHHSIYPSLTNVNSAALATGVHPARSGLIANWMFRPDLGTGKLQRTDAPEIVAKSDAASGGRYLTAATVAELVQARGGRTAIAGTKTAPLLQSRRAVRADGAAAKSVTVVGGKTLPPDALANVVKLIGDFPNTDDIPNVAEDTWTTRALTDVLWKDDVPEFSVLWLSEPDRTQHATAPGSEQALAAIKSADANLGLIVRALDEKKVLDKTDILLVSDHGFSTIERSVDVAGFLRGNGFDIAGEKDVVLARGQVRVAGNAGTNLYHVGEHDAATVARLIAVLQQSDFAGVIFAREPAEGTFPLSAIHINTASAPDVVMAFRWHAGHNSNGVAGMIAANGTGDANKGTHGTLSPFDVHNTFIAAGPDFRRGIESNLPTANTDVAATILHIMGITPPEPLDGRVVSEAFTRADKDQPATSSRTLEATRKLDRGVWRQYLQTSTVGESLYFDEGNGEFLSEPGK